MLLVFLLCFIMLWVVAFVQVSLLKTIPAPIEPCSGKSTRGTRSNPRCEGEEGSKQNMHVKSDGSHIRGKLYNQGAGSFALSLCPDKRDSHHAPEYVLGLTWVCLAALWP